MMRKAGCSRRGGGTKRCRRIGGACSIYVYDIKIYVAHASFTRIMSSTGRIVDFQKQRFRGLVFWLEPLDLGMDDGNVRICMRI